MSKILQNINSAADAVDENKGLALLTDGINTLVEGLPSLVKALDEIAKIHPFVGGNSSCFLKSLH